MNSPRCSAAQNTCTFSLIMWLTNLATNTPHSDRCCDHCKNPGFRKCDTEPEPGERA
jgi:hypothetical protein